MTDKISQRAINDAAWAACDTFRGVVDAAQYKDYILTMLFLKYVSDVWQDHFNEYKKRFGDDDERIRRRMEREKFFLPEGTSFYDLYRQRSADNIGEIINIALEKFETANKQKLDGVFRNIDFNSEINLGETKDRNRRLKNLLQDFAKPELNMSPSRVNEDVIGETYIYLISQFASDAGKKAGEFFTPRKISELLVRLVDPQPGNRVYDPACGSGSLLVRASEQIAANATTDQDKHNFQLYGQEVNSGTRALARMNMFLHGLDSAEIEWGDTLNSPKHLEGDALKRFDIVVANPPFSLKKWSGEEKKKGKDQDNEDTTGKIDPRIDPYNRYFRGIPPVSRADFAFVSHMVESARPKSGRAGVIAPHGVLFRGGAEGRIRQSMIEENLIDAVVGLPAQLFSSTGIPVCIVIFDRAREKGGAREDADDVMFIDASREFEPGKKQNQLLGKHLDAIVDAYRARQPVERYARPVPRTEIADNGFNLNIPRYIDTFEAEQEIDLAAVQSEIFDLEQQLAESRARINVYLRELGLDV
ncbi:type I restriction-modification system subunit M [Brucella anthropi]|uniref:type I restriction-modification system subunit M n=1 Tax=Brucella anthropi TaxID=529 RepID=UPI00124BE037|nr:type I restriction-modification system subunit M [Brucella anthropi]KAB2800012.1 type I restriction-modification system subunit M [Brucella anthropi]